MILKLFVNLFTFISPVQVNKDHWLSNNYLIVLFIRIIKSMGFVHLSPTDSQQDGFQTGALGLAIFIILFSVGSKYMQI